MADDYHNPHYPHKVFAKDDWFQGKEDHFVWGNVLKNDYDTYKHDLDAYVTDKPDHGTVYLDEESGHFKYVPHEGFVGTDYFEYKAFDKYGVHDVAQVKIEIKPKEKPHVVDAKDDKYWVKEGKKLEGNVLANDTDSIPGHDLDVVWHSHPKHGRLWIDYETGKFTYHAYKDKNKSDDKKHGDEKDWFEYKVSDGKGGYDTAKVYIDIKDGKWDDKGHQPDYQLMA